MSLLRSAPNTFALNSPMIGQLDGDLLGPIDDVRVGEYQAVRRHDEARTLGVHDAAILGAGNAP